MTMPLDPSLWPQIGEHLDYALDLPPEQRERWLAEFAAAQPALADALRQLLKEHQLLQANGFLEGSALAATPLPHTQIGQRIGAYTIQRPLGRGGMGEVWLAWRNDGHFEGCCAIKFLDSSAVHPRLTERFRREGRLLARLGHPNIARLMDAGKTPEGRQYLVLEHVDGERIDEYCQSQELSVSARARLFLDVVSAVGHAHSQLVVHRDLKPSNVLVTLDGHVKLLDFGIAKLLSTEPETEDAGHTRVEEIALTPEYAAPEQLLGESPSTATDIYQLGMLLYVLLTGRHPLQLSGSRAERIRTVLESRIPRASALAEGALRKELRGDLDAILEKALQTDPQQRYASADALGADLARYLNSEPVLARRSTFVYHARRFVARHRYAVGGAVVAVSSLCAALVYAVAQSNAASLQRDRAFALASRNAAVTEFLGVLITEVAEAGRPVTASELLERSEKLALADTSGNVENRAAVLAMIGARFGALGEYVKSARLFENAQALVANSPESGLRALLNCLHAAAISNLGQTDSAIRAIDHELTKVQSEPENAAYCLLYRAQMADASDAPAALRAAKQALELFHSAERTNAGDEGLFLGAVGRGYEINGRSADADRYYRLAIQKYIEIGREDGPNAVTVRNNWANAIRGAGDPKRALEQFEHLLNTRSRRNPDAAPPAFLAVNRARALEMAGSYAQARNAYSLSVRLSQQQQDVTGHALSLAGLASIAGTLGDHTSLADHIQQLTALLGADVPMHHRVWRVRALLQGRLELANGQLEAARTQFEWARLQEPSSFISVDATLGKAEVELRAGDPVHAAEEARLALKTAVSLQGGLAHSNMAGLSWLMLGRAQQQLGDSAGAHKSFEAAVENLSATVDENHPGLIQARRLVTGHSQADVSKTARSPPRRGSV